MIDSAKLLEQLVRMKAVTADVAAVNASTDFLYNLMKNEGFFCTVEELNGRRILYAGTKPGKMPDVLFNAHVDVVPPSFPEHFEPVVKDGWMFGRGAGDDLGNAVCIIQALCRMDRSVSAGVIFSTDEEAGGKTSAYMVEQGYSAEKAVIVMDHWEENAITYAEKGILSIDLIARGKSGHASRPWAYDNPVDKLLEGYARLKTVWAEEEKATEEDPWHNTMAATMLNAGVAGNQIPESATMRLNIRYVKPEDRERILKLIQDSTGLEAEVKGGCLPVVMDKDSSIMKTMARSMEKVLGVYPGFARMCGATDARWFVRTGAPVMILGTRSRGAHGKEDSVCLATIDQYAEILKDFAETV